MGARGPLTPSPPFLPPPLPHPPLPPPPPPPPLPPFPPSLPSASSLSPPPFIPLSQSFQKYADVSESRLLAREALIGAATVREWSPGIRDRTYETVY